MIASKLPKYNLETKFNLEEPMKQIFAGLCVLVLVFLISLSPPVQAETQRSMAGTFHYDVSKEITLNGTVASVLTKPTVGMIMGSHLMLTTLSGPVDASLGRFGLQGKGAASVARGQQVEVTGVMKTIHDHQVLLTRTLKVGGEVYSIRNQHGVPVSPQARERASGKTARKGESL